MFAVLPADVACTTVDRNRHRPDPGATESQQLHIKLQSLMTVVPWYIQIKNPIHEPWVVLWFRTIHLQKFPLPERNAKLGI